VSLHALVLVTESANEVEEQPQTEACSKTSNTHGFTDEFARAFLAATRAGPKTRAKKAANRNRNTNSEE
jgi:hypothetical protein